MALVGFSTLDIVGRELLLDGDVFHMKGVNWSPIPIGENVNYKTESFFDDFIDIDVDMMVDLGVNVVRTFEPILEIDVLDKLYENNIYVVSPLYLSAESDLEFSVGNTINRTKDHPSVLMWYIGNEWNFNGLYAGVDFDRALDLVNEAAELAKKLDPSRPVATLFGEFPPIDVLNRMPLIDVWGLNIYRGITFGNIFEEWELMTEKPMFIGEYGADAFNARINGEDQYEQANATKSLTQLLFENAVNYGGVSSGGFIFEFCDEWWKSSGGSDFAQEVGGISPGGGPHPDATFNEEWFGLVDIHRNKRDAYFAFKALPNPGSGPRLEVQGNKLLLNGEVFNMKGVNWNPIPVGQNEQDKNESFFDDYVALDGDLMVELGVNVVRTYEEIMDIKVLDELYARGIYVIMPIFLRAQFQEYEESVPRIMKRTRAHPAVLMWYIGNEWNYNGIYAGLPFEESLIRVKKAATLAKTLDSRPIASIYGELPELQVISDLPEIDVWGVNVYRSISFGDFFKNMAALTDKPLFLGEYGADAYNAKIPGEDQTSQAEATTVLTRLIHAESTVYGGAFSGGIIFEFADEWWKDASGEDDVHDVGGFAPGGGPHPDLTFNEEWWGLVDIDRTPRKAFYALKALPNPASGPRLEISGRNLLLGSDIFHMKGVNWNPIPVGENEDDKFESFFDDYVDLDGDLMQDLGINVVRTYEAIVDIAVLDALYARGIYVVSPVFLRADKEDFEITVPRIIQATRDHPAVLMWYVGNEWNYNGLYNGLSFDDSLDLVIRAATLAKQLDPSRPVATMYGELPPQDVLSKLDVIDIWGLNVYRGLGFGSLFEDWASRSDKPMFLGEYGADAYNMRINSEDQKEHARAISFLTGLLFDASTPNGGVSSGGMIFEFADEWWKAGNDDVHDVGGVSPGGGPHPDATFNEEWWGLVDIERKPRQAYSGLRVLNNPGTTRDLPKLQILGRKLLIEGQIFNMKGVNWNPVPIGENQDEKDRAYFRDYKDIDIPLMRQLGVNLVRTYEPIMDFDVLDQLLANNIYVMQPVFIDADIDVESSVPTIISQTKDHPAILMWYIGNEWNYNNLYSSVISFEDSVNLCNRAAEIAKQMDSRPVATIYGELPPKELIDRMPLMDIWGTNVYRGIGFGDVFVEWANRSGKPLFVGEYGADAYNVNIRGEDQASHAIATTVLTQLIFDASTVHGGAVSGGILFELQDEWWKAPGSDFEHDVGGIAPGGGPYPDDVFNEEWWGLLTIQRIPRQAFYAFQAVINPDDTNTQPPVPPPSNFPRLSIQGRKLLIDGEVFIMKGINWNPIPRGENQDEKNRTFFDVYAEVDIGLMAELGINLVRTYEPIVDIEVLDMLHENGIYVMQPIYIDADIEIISSVQQTIIATKDHPAVLLWYIGNEWNYNLLYAQISFEESVRLINLAAQIAKSFDSTRPVATIFGELPWPELIDSMPLIDMWGTNVYRDIGFGNIFTEWAEISDKPLFLGEYGADAYNVDIAGEDQASHALATEVLTEAIFAQSTIYNGVCSGGILFELADEWWKAGNDNQHDIGGIAPGGGPYPDGVFNEEWWGLVDIDRQKRTAFNAFKNVVNPILLPPGEPPVIDFGERLQIQGRKILIDGKIFVMKGMNWNPVPIGENQDEKDRAYFRNYASLDIPMLKELGVNLVRTYEPILDVEVLDMLLENNMYLMQPVFIDADIDVETSVADIIEATDDHPVVLMWYIGNEWNYNQLYADISFDESVAQVNRAAEIIKSMDTTRPVVTIFGELPWVELIDSMPLIDVWGTNVYRSIEFGDLFDVWESRSTKPLFLGEYGADAYNANIPGEDQESHALATKVLTELIFEASTVNGGVVSGGILFEFNDEWWKAPGSDFEHDVGGIAPGGGPYPDIVFNEEWWGLVDIHRTKRLAYNAFRDVVNPDETKTQPGGAPEPPAMKLEVSGRDLLIDGELFVMKGINWNPIPRGVNQDEKTKNYFTEYLNLDGALLEELGVNLVRTYEPIYDTTVLDYLYEKGIYLMQPIYIDADLEINFAVSDAIIRTKNHPAVLMWYIGNEWNYNSLYSDPFDLDRTIDLINLALDIAKKLDPSRPVASIYGELPPKEFLDRLSLVDIWGINVYREIGFGDLFQDWRKLSGKPVFIGEYGADAYNTLIDAEDQESQEHATKVLTELIFEASTANNGVCSGGVLFELADEWWKAPGSDFEHDVGGIAPGEGPYPDKVFNEEWWGLVDMDRRKRSAFAAFQNVSIPVDNRFVAEETNDSVAIGIGFGILFLVALLGMIGYFMTSKKKQAASTVADKSTAVVVEATL